MTYSTMKELGLDGTAWEGRDILCTYVFHVVSTVIYSQGPQKGTRRSIASKHVFVWCLQNYTNATYNNVSYIKSFD